jgi:hypothetical protein
LRHCAQVICSMYDGRWTHGRTDQGAGVGGERTGDERAVGVGVMK